MKVFLLLFLPLFGMAQEQTWKPIGGFYAGVGTYMLQSGVEAGFEKGRGSGMIDVTYYFQGVASVGAKAAVKAIYLDTYENEFISLLAGWTRYNYNDPLEGKFKHQSALLAIRWNNYNTVADFGWKDGGIFFAVGWQFRKINR
jgi:hypothetical protein